MSKHNFHINSNDKKHEAIARLLDTPTDGSIQVTIERLPQTRTSQQNRALHLWCRLVSADLNEHGVTVPVLLQNAADVDWDKDGISFKKLVWSKIQKVMVDEESTADALIDEYPLIYETVNRFLSSHGVHIPWPVKNDK